MQKERKAATTSVLDEAFQNLDEAKTNLSKENVRDAICVLDSVGSLLYHLSENPHMDSDAWKNLAMNLGTTIEAAVLSAQEQMKTLEKGIEQSYKAHNLLRQLRTKPISITVQKPIRKRVAA
jgi:hypothetical protein